MRTWLRTLVLVLMVAGCNQEDPRHFTSATADVGGGRRMYFECEGAGSPTVILIAGKGNRADTWSTNVTDAGKADATVFHAIGAQTRVCAYDRPRTVGLKDEPSRSDPVPEPLSAKDAADDLHALLVAAKIPGPYVIVGHSYGGLVARLYASLHPESVAGIVLEDALSEGLYDGLRPDYRAILERINAGREEIDNDKSFAQVAAAPAVRPVPMVILTADQRPITAQDIASGNLPADVTIEFADALWAAQMAAQDGLARRFPQARHVTKTNSHHYIHYEQPQLVIDAIREVVSAVRGR